MHSDFYTDIRTLKKRPNEDFHNTIQAKPLSSIGDLKMQVTRDLYDWWTSFSPSRPKKSDFRITDHMRHAPNIFLVEQLAPSTYKFLVCGEEIAKITGRNTHGLIIYPRNAPESYERNFKELIKYYDTIISDNKPCYCTGTVYSADDIGQDFESIDCPMVNEEGEVKYILGAMKLAYSQN